MKSVRHFLVAGIAFVATLGCRSDNDSAPEAAPTLIESPALATERHSVDDSLVLWYCGTSGRVGFDSLGAGDTVGVYLDGFQKLSWDGGYDSIETPGGIYPLRTVAIACDKLPYRVAVLNPTSSSFLPVELDTLVDASDWFTPEIVSVARKAHPDTVFAPDQPPYAVNDYSKPPRVYKRKGSSSPSLLLQFSCTWDNRCGPVFYVAGDRLVPFEGENTDPRLQNSLFEYAGSTYLHLNDGRADCGDVWDGIHRLEKDTAITLVIDGRFGN